MAKVYYDADADPRLLKGKTVAVMGYGSQGHAHALNLKDSGVKVVVGLRAGPSWDKAEAAGLQALTPEDAAKEADIVILLVPDHAQKDLYCCFIEPHMERGKTLMFAHGFNIHYSQIVPPPGVDVSMIAPKSPGPVLRQFFTQGIGVPALVAVHQDASGKALQTALAYGRALGCTRAGVLETTFAEETETDLFGEQTVLCGGITSLIKAAFETLVEAGYQPEIAYFECLHEVKLIVDLIYQGGMEYMRYSVSDTAEYGDYTRGSRVIDGHVKENMKKILADIQSGAFAREWIAENKEGRTNFEALRKRDASHQVEEVGKELRAMMSFLSKSK